jgi:hypothetical protein
MTKHSSGKSESSTDKVPIPIIILFCLVFLFFLVGSVLYYVADLGEYRQLKTSHVVAQGTIIDRKAETDVDSDGNMYTHYSITYQFTDGKSRYTRTRGVSESIYDSLKGRETVSIVYVPSNPEISRLKSNFTVPIPQMPVMVLLIFAACACQLLRGSEGSAAVEQVLPVALTIWRQICGAAGSVEPPPGRGSE